MKFIVKISHYMLVYHLIY